MSDQTRIPGFIYHDDVLRQAKAAETWVNRSRNRAVVLNRFLAAYATLVTVLLIMSSVALDYAVPAIRILPVFFYQKPDGVLETAITTESLPGTLADADVQAWLWQYVFHRESYSSPEMDTNNHVVQAMSDKAVRDAYIQWSSGKNPQSYLARYSNSVVIRVGLRAIRNWQRSIGGQPGSVTFDFDRLVYTKDGPPPKAVTYTVTLTFIQDYNAGFNIHDLLAFNPARIVVTDYPGAQTLAAVVQ